MPQFIVKPSFCFVHGILSVTYRSSYGRICTYILHSRDTLNLTAMGAVDLVTVGTQPFCHGLAEA